MNGNTAMKWLQTHLNIRDPKRTDHLIAVTANPKNALIINDPKKYRLPIFGPQPSYVIAKNSNYFVYPNQLHKYQFKFNNSFQHGGISMEEMIVPIAIMRSRKE